MDYKVKGIVLYSVDSGENDKIVTILTDDLGKIRMKVKGVRRAQSKHKFAVQPFAFIECLLIKRGDFFTLTTANSVHAFFEILDDYDRMNAGFVVLEVADKISYYGEVTSLLLPTLRGLETISYAKDIQVAIAYFLKNILAESGYRLQLNLCSECGSELEFAERMAIDLESGMKCKNCMQTSDKSISLKTLESLRIVFSSEYRDEPLEVSGVINLLKKLLEKNFACKINSL